MPAIFRNQILASSRPVNITEANLCTLKFGNLHFYHSSNVPIIKTPHCLLFGWAWDCNCGSVVSDLDLTDISENNVIDRTESFSGRYLIVVGDRWIFPDTAGSCALYYSGNMASTNLSLLSHALGLEPRSFDDYTAPAILPPATVVKGVAKLLPGQYLEIDDNSKAVSIPGLFGESTTSSIEERVHRISKHLEGSAQGLKDLTQHNSRLMLTAGKDSRLSLQHLYAIYKDKLKTVTHRKPYLFTDTNDLKVPPALSRALGFHHQVTQPHKALSADKLSELRLHNPYLAGERQLGSGASFYRYQNLEQVSEEFLVDNYYEIGRMHLHGQRWLANADAIDKERISQGYEVDDESYQAFKKHMTEIAGSADLLDVFYYLKNYSSVSYTYELLDFSHTPLIFCSSLYLLRELLHVPEEYRIGGRFHMMLLDANKPKQIANIACNPNATTLSYKIRRKLKSKVEKYVI